MAITRDRLGRFSGSGSKGGVKGMHENVRQGLMKKGGGSQGNRSAAGKSTLGERMKSRLQSKQSKQVSNAMGTGSAKGMKLATRIMDAQRKGRKS